MNGALFEVPGEGYPLLAAALIASDSDRGYKGALDGLDPSLAETDAGDDDATARLRVHLARVQDVIHKMDAALSQKVMECGDLARRIKCLKTGVCTTGYGKVLLEPVIGQPLRRVVRIPVETDTTNSLTDPSYVILKAEDGGWVPYEVDPAEYDEAMANVTFEEPAGTTAKRAPRPRQSQPQTNSVDMPRTAAEQFGYAGPRYKFTRRRSEYTSLELRCKPSVSWPGGGAIKPCWAGDDDEGNDGNDAFNGGNDEGIDGSVKDADGEFNAATDETTPRRVTGGGRMGTTRGADGDVLANASPDTKVEESPRNPHQPMALPLPKVNLTPSKKALLEHTKELLADLKSKGAATHPYGLFNKAGAPTHDLYTVRAPRTFVKRRVSVSPVAAQCVHVLGAFATRRAVWVFVGLTGLTGVHTFGVRR